MTRRIAAIAAALGLAASVTVGAGSRAFPVRNGEIVFESGRLGGGSGLYVMRPDGTKQHRLGRLRGASPKWSRDGERLALVGSGLRLFVARSNGTGLRQVTRGRALVYDPSWAPDGRRIAIATTRGSDVEHIWTIGVDGTGIRRLTYRSTQDVNPAWSPDGKTIAFAHDDRIWLMNADGTNQRPVSEPPSFGSDGQPAWSFNGRRIVFSRSWAQEEPGQDIFVIDADGGGEEQLTEGKRLNAWPAWSPDGRRIVFASDRRHADEHDIYVMDADATRQKRLTKVRGDHTAPDWQPLR